jgi:hypothetical protein
MLAAAGLVLALVAAGCVSFNVTKEVTGGGEPDGPFIVNIDCEGQNPDEIPFSGSAADYPQTKESIDFDLDQVGNASCLITEPEAANAATTTIECVEPDPLTVTCTDTPDGLLVEIDESAPDPEQPELGPEVSVDIIVTNDIPTTTTSTTTTAPPPEPLAIVAEPAFTG